MTSIWCADRNFALDKFIELCDLVLPLGLTVDLEFVTFAAVRTFAEARDGRLYLGEGGIDNYRIIECMPRIPYSIELPNSKRLAELSPEQYARAALVSTKQYFLDRGRPVNVT